jgi:hypothetical protein
MEENKEYKIEPYEVDKDGNICWCVMINGKVRALSNYAGCEKIVEAMKNHVPDPNWSIDDIIKPFLQTNDKKGTT